jgi:hypothetical protein
VIDPRFGKRDGRHVEQFATSAGRARDLSEDAGVLGLMYQKFGGPDGFVEAFWDEFRAAPPGSYRRTKLLDMIAHLTQLNSVRLDAESEARKREYSLMSDEELEEERMRIMGESIVKIVAAQPELSVWAAEQLGWTVIPPDDSLAEGPVEPSDSA